MRMHTDKVFSSDATEHGLMNVPRWAPKTFKLLGDSMVFKDDPEHLRLRSLVNRAFTPKLVANMAADIDDVVETHLRRLEGRDTVDLVEEYAVQIPLAVIARMLGMGAEDGASFHTWMKNFAESTTNGPLEMIRALPTARRMRKMFERLAEQRRREPDDRLITALVQARDDDDGLDETELQAMIFLLLLAGHDTTSNLIGTATVALLENRDQLERLRAEPELIDTAVEELLRYTTPVPCGAPRFLTEDVEMSGTTLKAGSVVLGMIISANRDDAMFDDPDTLDLARTPNKQLAFAFGAHYCLGNQLARLEGRAALGALVQRFDRIELAVPPEELRFKATPSLRGYRELPLRLA
jgi:cytochrome P450 PksS